MNERFNMAGGQRDRISDRRPATERPSVLKDRPQDVAADRHMDPKGAHQPTTKTHISSSDRTPRSMNSAPKTDPNARKAVKSHVASKAGKGGGKPENEAPGFSERAQADMAKSAGLSVKVVQIVRPANARPIISPNGAMQGCSGSGKCLDGEGDKTVPTMSGGQNRYTPAAITKARDALGNIKNEAASKKSGPAPITPSAAAKPNSPPSDKVHSDPAAIKEQPNQKGRPDDR
jgi:hypothetical protein